MEVPQVLHMIGGEGETSYASNSILQRAVIEKAKTIIEDTIQDLCRTVLTQCLTVADFGCSSGPNTLLVISEIIEAVEKTCSRLSRQSPELQVFLNDLPGNDFNTIFRSLPTFYEKLKKEKGKELGKCFVTGMPGSFYGRLFPSKSLHFVHSSYSGHWLSQVPQGLEGGTDFELNKGNIYIVEKSPRSVLNAYLEQFHKDFSLFLKLRSEEIVPTGRMVLTIMGRRRDDPWSNESGKIWELLSMALNDLVLEGLIEEAKLDSFNLPYYAPSANEIREIVQKEGSFKLEQIETFDVNWDADLDDDGNNNGLVFHKLTSAQKVAKCIRAVAEPLVVNHFGEAIIEDLFHRFMEKVVEHQAKEKGKYINLVISMTRKG